MNAFWAGSCSEHGITGEHGIQIDIWLYRFFIAQGELACTLASLSAGFYQDRGHWSGRHLGQQHCAEAFLRLIALEHKADDPKIYKKIMKNDIQRWDTEKIKTLMIGCTCYFFPFNLFSKHVYVLLLRFMPICTNCKILLFFMFCFCCRWCCCSSSCGSWCFLCCFWCCTSCCCQLFGALLCFALSVSFALAVSFFFAHGTWKSFLLVFFSFLLSASTIRYGDVMLLYLCYDDRSMPTQVCITLVASRCRTVVCCSLAWIDQYHCRIPAKWWNSPICEGAASYANSWSPSVRTEVTLPLWCFFRTLIRKEPAQSTMRPHRLKKKKLWTSTECLQTTSVTRVVNRNQSSPLAHSYHRLLTHRCSCLPGPHPQGRLEYQAHQSGAFFFGLLPSPDSDCFRFIFNVSAHIFNTSCDIPLSPAL